MAHRSKLMDCTAVSIVIMQWLVDKLAVIIC